MEERYCNENDETCLYSSDSSSNVYDFRYKLDRLDSFKKGILRRQKSFNKGLKVQFNELASVYLFESGKSIYKNEEDREKKSHIQQNTALSPYPTRKTHIKIEKDIKKDPEEEMFPLFDNIKGYGIF